MKLLSMQADDHQEQPFRVDPLLPEQMRGEFNKGQNPVYKYLFFCNFGRSLRFL